MGSDALRELLERHPFKPVTLLLPSGKTFTIKNPELYMFTETGRTVIVTEGDKVFLVDVTTVEAVETTPAEG